MESTLKPVKFEQRSRTKMQKLKDADTQMSPKDGDTVQMPQKQHIRMESVKNEKDLILPDMKHRKRNSMGDIPESYTVKPDSPKDNQSLHLNFIGVK